MMQTIVICNLKYCKVYRQKLFSCLFVAFSFACVSAFAKFNLHLAG